MNCLWKASLRSGVSKANMGRGCIQLCSLIWPVLICIGVIAIFFRWLLKASIVVCSWIRWIFRRICAAWLHETSSNSACSVLARAHSPVYESSIQMQATWSVWIICWVSRRDYTRCTLRFLKYSDLIGREIEVLLIRAGLQLLLLSVCVNQIAEWTTCRSLS